MALLDSTAVAFLTKNKSFSLQASFTEDCHRLSSGYLLWLRTYLLERCDVTHKSELGRVAMAQQRMQQNISSGLGDGNTRLQGQNDTVNKVQQDNQSSGGMSYQDGGNPNGQESERSTTVDGNVHSEAGQQQNASSISEASQNALRRNGALGDEFIEETLKKVVKILAYIINKDLFAEFYRR